MGEVLLIDREEVALPASSSLSLSLPEGLTFEGWQGVGRELAAREKVLNWWIGDWWAFGEHRYGERAKVAAQSIFPQAFQTLMKIGSVARAFPESFRQQKVSFTHHEELAALARSAPEKAEALLGRAEREGLTVAQVRAAVREAQGRPLDQALSARDEDPDHYLVLSVTRQWNRVPIHVRKTIAEMIIEAIKNDYADIDP